MEQVNHSITQHTNIRQNIHTYDMWTMTRHIQAVHIILSQPCALRFASNAFAKSLQRKVSFMFVADYTPDKHTFGPLGRFPVLHAHKHTHTFRRILFTKIYSTWKIVKQANWTSRNIIELVYSYKYIFLNFLRQTEKYSTKKKRISDVSNLKVIS